MKKVMQNKYQHICFLLKYISPSLAYHQIVTTLHSLFGSVAWIDQLHATIEYKTKQRPALHKVGRCGKIKRIYFAKFKRPEFDFPLLCEIQKMRISQELLWENRKNLLCEILILGIYFEIPAILRESHSLFFSL